MVPIIYITFVGGLALLVIAVIGGGLEVKEFKIPSLPAVPRVLSFLLGCILIAVSVFDPGILPGGTPAQSSPPPNITGQPPPPATAQSLLLVYALLQKDLATRLDTYLSGNGYDIKASTDDFSGIAPADREKPGTIRIVYRPAAKDAEAKLIAAMRAQFPSETARLVEKINISASVDLQVQLW